MRRFNNLKILKDRRKDLRKNQTPAEYLLWQYLRANRLENIKFKKQHSVGFFILDFYSPVNKLAIEIDGDSHFQENTQEYDKERTLFLESLFIKVIRFTNVEVFQNIEYVLGEILKNIKTQTSPNLSLVGEGQGSENSLCFKEKDKGV